MARRKSNVGGLAIIFVIALAIIVWVIESIVGILGFMMAGWGIYEVAYRKKLNTKISAAFIIIGLIIGIGWFALSEDEYKQIVLTASPVTTESARTEKQNESSKLSSGNQQSIKSISAVTTTNLSQATQEINESETDGQDANYIAASIIEIVDGDTIKVSIDGKKETVRLLLVDTPETKDPNEPVQPFGPEATEYAEKTLSGRDVRLELDGPERDKYDRLLAYMWIGDKIFNQMLLEEGLARIAYVYDPPYTHYDAFIAAEEKARIAKKGIWSIEGYVTADGFREEMVAVKEEPKPEPKPTNQRVHYKNCAAARAAGAAPLYRGDPGYRPALDRDGDGIACE